MHHYNHLRGLLTSSSLVKGSRPLFSSSGIEKTKPEIDAKTKTAASIFEKSPSPEKSVFELPEHLRRKMTECQCHHRGSIHLITGPMFSGKT
jgi:hypothetical protein